MDGASDNERTLETYERFAERYDALRSQDPEARVARWLRSLADRVPTGGRVLDVGGGPGYDADVLEELGLEVRRTDGAAAFVRLQQARGHQAEQLDVRRDDLGGPYDMVVANAVFLHLSRSELRDLLRRLVTAVLPGGLLAFTVKEGDGDAWSLAKLDAPRHFVFWREDPLRALLVESGWQVESIDHEQERDPWLVVAAHRPGPRS